MTIQTIPLASLQLSTLNARKTGGENVADLIASIEADGLLQNLTVVKAKKGKFDVVAGGRRLRALQSLVKSGHLATDYEAPCRVVDEAVAMDASTAENTIREAMNPADEIAAYTALINAGRSVTDIAVRFGQSERHVNGMLRLGTVSPKILDLLRKDEIRLDQVKALTVTTDHAKQEHVWEQSGDFDNDPDDLRAALTDDTVYGVSKVAKFITVEAYEAAGGALHRDLFGDEVFLHDHLLVESLALEKLERTAVKERKKGWAWVECRLDLPYSTTSKLECLRHPTAEDKTVAGVFVTIGHNGKPEVSDAYVRPGDRKRVEAGLEVAAAQQPGQPAPPAPVNDELSKPQVNRLLGWRTAILRAELAHKPHIMLAALIAEFVEDQLGIYGGTGIVKVHGRATLNEADQIKGFREALASGINNEALETQWTERLQAQPDLFNYLLEQDTGTLLRLLAFLVAQTIVVDSPSDTADQFQALAMIDMRSHWAPTGEWLATLSRAAILRILREANAAVDADLEALGKLKKSELVPKAAEMLASTNYLPECLRGEAEVAK
jgi:ParB family chromosome partitioning protein